MRERLSSIDANKVAFGITPAYAGKTWPKKSYGETGGDHPRVCGKDFTNDVKKHVDQGSPPRMRERLDTIMNL